MPKAKKAKSKVLSASPQPSHHHSPGSTDPQPHHALLHDAPINPVKTTSTKSRAAQSGIVVSQGDGPMSSSITTRGQRFAVHQIGSMFGRE